MIMSKTFFLLVLIIFLFCNSCSGPNSYEECVVEGMKGQDKSVMPYVQDVCEKKFPYLKNITYFYSDYLDLFYMIDPENISLVIEENKGSYKISQISVGFYKKTCELVKSNSSPEAIADFVFKDDSISQVQIDDALDYKCFKITAIFGYRNK